MDIPRVSPKEPLRTDADLRRWARFISGGLNPLRRTLWVMFLDRDDKPVPTVLPIDGIPDLPDEEASRMAHNLSKIGQDMAPGGAVVLMLERPGVMRRAAADDAWHSMLRRELTAAGMRVRAMFLAAGGQVETFALDDAA